MTKYESDVKLIYAPQDAVYAKLSDLTHLSVIRDRIDGPMVEQNIMAHAGDKVKPEQLEQIVEKLRSLQFDTDSVSGETPLGTATLRIIEREPEKTIKFAAEGMPVAANMWVQLLPNGENECAMRLTLKADLNFFIRQMVGKKLEQGVDGLAQMLASLPY